MASGKTTLVEALASECIGKEMGSIEKKNTISDYLDEERQRGSSIKSSIIPLNFKDYKINLIDLPGMMILFKRQLVRYPLLKELF